MIEEAVAGPEFVHDGGLLDRETAGPTHKQGQRVIGIGDMTPRSRVGRGWSDDPRDADVSGLEKLDAAFEYAVRTVFDASLAEILAEILSENLKSVALPQAMRRELQTMGHLSHRGLR